MRIALIDADVFAFASAVSVEKGTDWGDGVWTVHADENEARRRFDNSVAKVLEKAKADKCILAFSDSENWRKSVLPTYKANRAGSRQPIIRKAITEWAKGEYVSVTRPTLEGDDVLGILATKKKTIPGDQYIICTIDKDLKTVPGLHYSINHDKLFEVSVEEADRWHLAQTLAGDRVDGYEGCPGVGMDTALAFLKEPFIWERHDHIILRGARKGQSEPRYRKAPLDGRSVWDAVVSVYDKAGLCEEEALIQARVARICRAEDYNFKKKEVILWTPDSK